MQADAECLPHLPADATVAATDESFNTEFLDLVIAV